MKKLFTLILFVTMIACTGCGSKSEKVNPYEQYKSAPITFSERVFYEMYTKMPKANIFMKEREKLFKELKKFDAEKPIPLKKVRSSIFSTPHMEVTDLQTSEYKYIGELKNGKPHGIGTVRCYRNKEYSGYWEDGIPEGYGIWYTGNFFGPSLPKSMPNIHFYINPVLYEGESEDWEPQGEGVRFKYTNLALNGSNVSGILYVYVGEFDGTDIEGNFDVYASVHGKTLIPKYLREYDGYYEKEEYVYQPDGLSYHCYTGDVEYGKFEGKGTSYYPNGNIHFKGEFKMDRLTSKGVMYNEKGVKIYDNP